MGVMHALMVMCGTFNPKGSGSIFDDSFWIIVGMSLGKTVWSPSLKVVKPSTYMNVRYHSDMSEIMLKVG